jgi:hypothetical protein
MTSLLEKIALTYLDNGFYKVSRAAALLLAEGNLPRHGYERAVMYGGKLWWLARTPHQGKSVWSIRLVNRNA